MILNGKVFNPGELRTKVALERRSVSTGTGGFQVPAWQEFAQVKSKWVNVHGSETWAAQTAGALEPATVTIRYRSDLDATCAIRKGTVRYEIISLDNIQERNEYLEIKVQRIRSG